MCWKLTSRSSSNGSLRNVSQNLLWDYFHEKNFRLNILLNAQFQSFHIRTNLWWEVIFIRSFVWYINEFYVEIYNHTDKGLYTRKAPWIPTCFPFQHERKRAVRSSISPLIISSVIQWIHWQIPTEFSIWNLIWNWFDTKLTITFEFYEFDKTHPLSHTNLKRVPITCKHLFHLMRTNITNYNEKVTYTSYTCSLIKSNVEKHSIHISIANMTITIFNSFVA